MIIQRCISVQTRRKLLSEPLPAGGYEVDLNNPGIEYPQLLSSPCHKPFQTPSQTSGLYGPNANDRRWPAFDGAALLSSLSNYVCRNGGDKGVNKESG